jgi:hypothetical protein
MNCKYVVFRVKAVWLQTLQKMDETRASNKFRGKAFKKVNSLQFLPFFSRFSEDSLFRKPSGLAFVKIFNSVSEKLDQRLYFHLMSVKAVIFYK